MLHKSLKLCAWLTAWFVFLVVSGCAVPVMPGPQVSREPLTLEEEKALGQRAHQQLVQQMGGVYPDRELNIYVNRIGQWLAAKSERPDLEYHFQVINDSAPNTFSLPGGYVGITRGLMVRLQSEAQLAAVLGFEIGHVVAQHHLQGIAPENLRERPVSLIDRLSADSDYAALVSSLPRVGIELIEKSYNREHERVADRMGIDLMVAAGYRPSAAVEVLELFLDEQQGDEDGLGSLFRSHPFSEKRLKETREYVESRYPDCGGRIGELDFSVVVTGLKAVEEGYELYDQARKLERQGEDMAAIETYHEALMSAPDEALILAGLGLAYLRNEDSVPARRYLIKAVNLQGDYSQSRLGLGYVYLQKWQYAQAISQLEESLRLLPTLEAAFLLAESQQRIGHKVKARDLYLIVASADRDGKLGKLAKDRLKQMKGK